MAVQHRRVLQIQALWNVHCLWVQRTALLCALDGGCNVTSFYFALCAVRVGAMWRPTNLRGRRNGDGTHNMPSLLSHLILVQCCHWVDSLLPVQHLLRVGRSGDGMHTVPSYFT
jgi:hypothetical protein